MFKFILGVVLGANLSLIFYACILAGKRADAHIKIEGGSDERRSSD